MPALRSLWTGLTRSALGATLCAGVSAGALLPASAAAQDPLSAIDWLEHRNSELRPKPIDPALLREPPVATSVTIPQVTVTPLGAPQRSAAGLLPSRVTGLPRTLWVGSDSSDVSALVRALDVTQTPALQALLYTLLLAEADAPRDDQQDGFLRERVRKLLDLGAVDPAASLLGQAGPANAQLFDLYFDTALLAGDTSGPCTALSANPVVTQDYGARIYCSARTGQWDQAALTLTAADAIGALPEADTAMLERFLDPELFARAGRLPDASKPSPLQYRLFEATGEALPTADLPRAFAVTDLGGDKGWKAQAEAAERLARVGAISENRLIGIYTSNVPSASGGIWDRIEAIQKFDTAVQSGDPAAILKRAQTLWKQALRARLIVPVATYFGKDLLTKTPARLPNSDIITRLALLSPDYEAAAKRKSSDPRIKAAQAVARGEAPAKGDQIQSAIHAAFTKAEPPSSLTRMAQNDQLGEALLRALALAASGAEGDPAALISALSFMRSVGMEDSARRVALQLMLLDGDRR